MKGDQKGKYSTCRIWSLYCDLGLGIGVGDGKERDGEHSLTKLGSFGENGILEAGIALLVLWTCSFLVRSLQFLPLLASCCGLGFWGLRVLGLLLSS